MELIIGAVLLLIVAIFGSKKLALNSSSVYQSYKKEIDLASNKWGVPKEIIAGVIETESNGNAQAVGGSGEVGLMQLQPGQLIVDLFALGMTPRQQPTFDPSENIHDGTAGLKLLKDRAGSWRDAIRAYNCCGTNIKRVKENEAISSGYADIVIANARRNGWAGVA